jgi:RNA polymerase sigma factor for flagellar operon FliA
MVEFTEQGRLWARYRATRDPRAHERLINEYAPLVGYIAGRLRSHLPQHIDEGDLNQWGLLGLVDAIERYDPTRAVKFETFAMARIRGAIIDELRGLDWVPRQVRSRARQVELAMVQIEREKGTTATDAEVAERLGVTLEVLDATLVDISRGSLTALDDAFVGAGTPEAIALIDVVADTHASSPTQSVARGERTDVMQEAIEALPERERLVVRLYYYEEMTLKEIAKILGVSESRASQLHSKGILRLRARLQEDSDQVLDIDA